MNLDMSGKEGKRLKERRNLHTQTKNVLNPPIATGPVVSQAMELLEDGSAQQSFNSLEVGVKLSLCDSAAEFGCTPKYLFEDSERITELMDAPAELDMPPHSISRGPNPYLDRCIYCNSPRGEFQEYEKGIEFIDVQLPDNSVVNGLVNSHSFSSLKMEIWICANCRKIAGNFQSIWEEHFPQPYSLPILHDKACMDPVSCAKCQEECEAIEKEEIELEQNEIELCFFVKDFYSCEEIVFSQEQEERLNFLIDKLCSRDPHQLFLQLESHLQDVVLGIKTNLLVRLKERDLATSELAFNFTSSLLSHYDLFTKKACLFAQYLGELNEHLLELKLTWELLNKQVFHSIVYSDPIISSCRLSMLEQLRQCSVQYEKVADNPYSSVFHRLLKIQEEMTVVVILWRECQELIENYSQKEIMRQFLKKHHIKDCGVNELSESGRNSLSPPASADKVEYHNCIPEREFGDVFLGCDGRHDQTSSINEDANTDDIDDSPGDYYEDADEDDNTDSSDIRFSDAHSVEIPVCELKSTDAVWEAIQQHQQLLQQQQLLRSTTHNCPHCKQTRHGQQCPFQTKADAGMLQQSQTDQIPADAGDRCTETLADVNNTAGGDDTVNPGVCSTCQCHACLKQSGHVISASLPLQIPVSSPPRELYLYPHIHGLPQQQQQQHYLLDLPPPILPPIKLPVKLDFDNHHGLQGHLSYVYSDWENTVPEPVATQHNHQHHHLLPDISADHFHPPHMVTTASPFNFDLAFHLANHNMHTLSTNTTSVFKTVASKPILASSILSNLHGVGHVPSEGSSVDPSHPLDFPSHSKIPHSCVSPASSLSSCSFSSHSCFCPTLTTASSISTPTVSMASAVPKSSTSCHSPSCSRLTPVADNTSSSKWERSQHCRKFNAGNKPVTAVQSPQSQQPIGTQHLADGTQAPSLATLPDVLKNFNFTPKHMNQPAYPPSPRPTGLPPNNPHCASGTSTSGPTTGASSGSVSCSNSLPAMVTNIDVGTSTPCTDPECEAHYEDNCDSIDDSCSEKSSGTSTSNQKEGKYCDCCYCEFFGHNNTQVPRVSTNYIEMKDRLRKKLKKRQSENKHKEVPNDGFIQESSKEELDPLEKKGLDGLLSFINGTDRECPEKVTDKEITAKAAKRARQKQRKLEAKATQAKSSSPVDTCHHPESQKSLDEQLLNHNLNIHSESHLDLKRDSATPKPGKAPSETNTAKNALNDLVTKKAGSPLSKQEINRSSLVIQSTRSTFSLPQKNVDVNAGCQHHVSDSNIESPEHMIQFLNALQQYHHKENKKEPSPSAVSTTNHIHANQATSYQTDSTSSQVKSSKIVSKVNDVARQKQNHHLDQPPLLSNQQQKQQEPTKSLNGTGTVSPKPSKIGSPVSTNGNCNTLNSHSEAHSHSHMNGKTVQNNSVTTKLVMPASSSVVNSVTSQSSLFISPSAGSCSKISQPTDGGTKAPVDQGKTNGGRTKKIKKKNRNGYVTGVDEIFIPKSESEMEGDVDDFERELEEFKRFCFEPAEPKERRKIAVNVNLKDIFKKKAAVV